MQPYVTVALLAGVVAIQTALVPFAALGSVKPLLPLLAVVAWGLLRGPWASLWWALVLGLIMDAVSPGPFGFYALPLAAVAGVTAIGRGRLAPGNLLLPGLVAAVATGVFSLAQRTLLWTMLETSGNEGRLSWSAADLADELLPVVALNLLWLPVLFFPLRRLAAHIAPARIEWER